MSNPIVSICIPSYNGNARLLKLLKYVLASSRRDFEVIIVDDCSNDETWSLLSKLKSDTRLKCYRNTRNLGMDRNFAKTVEYATGDYVWFCGQDDIILSNGVDSILDTLIQNPDVDFIYLNHKSVIEGFESYDLSSQKLGSNNLYGVGINSFLQMSGGELPTFLPKYLIRKCLWNAADVQKYFGTSYCQVGVFLESSSNIKWCYHSGEFVIGLLPIDGWQKNPSKYVSIIIGYFVMLDRFYMTNKLTDLNFIQKQFSQHTKEFLYTLLLLRRFEISLSQNLSKEFLSALKRYNFGFWIKLWNLKLPIFFWKTLWKLFSLKKLVR